MAGTDSCSKQAKAALLSILVKPLASEFHP
jgi:hypothetical protein